MAEFPALPLWTDAYIADTVHLTVTESGAYLHLLMAAWRSPDGMLPNDPKILARLAHCTTREWRHVNDTILAFFKTDSGTGKLYQPRLLRELEYVRKRSSRARHAANARYLKNKESSSADAAPEQMQNEDLADAPDLLEDYESSAQELPHARRRAPVTTPTPTPTPTPTKQKKEIPPEGFLSYPQGSPNGQAPPGPTSLWAIDERTGDPLKPHRHSYKRSDDDTIETERIVAWYGELVSEIFARPPRQPYAGKPSEGSLGDAEVAASWVSRGFNAKFAGEIFRQVLEDRRDDGDQPPRSLSYFENSVAAYIARNPSWFPQPRMFSDAQVAEIKAKNAAALSPREQGAADLAKLKAMTPRPRRGGA